MDSCCNGEVGVSLFGEGQRSLHKGSLRSIFQYSWKTLVSSATFIVHPTTSKTDPATYVAPSSLYLKHDVTCALTKPHACMKA